jgi:chromosome partitioning protein
MIISIVNQKGGVGKTTLTLSIAHQLALIYKEDILVVDADPQQSCLTWSSMRDRKLPFAMIGLAKKSLHRDLPAIAKNYKHIIIDSPPTTTDLTRSCIMAAELVLVPCTPSPYDIWASAGTIELIKEATVYKEKLNSAFVINRKISNTIIARDAHDALKEMDFSILNNEITQRIIFAEAATFGKTIIDIEPEGKAAYEIASLVSEILFNEEIKDV